MTAKEVREMCAKVAEEYAERNKWSADAVGSGVDIAEEIRALPLPEPPGHTNLMVTPESLDKYMADNPIPEPTMGVREEIAKRLAHHLDDEAWKNWEQAQPLKGEFDFADQLLAAGFTRSDAAVVEAARKLERAAKIISSLGARTGPQWTDLALVLMDMRAALAAHDKRGGNDA